MLLALLEIEGGTGLLADIGLQKARVEHSILTLLTSIAPDATT
jgi:hypothetical protein